MSKKFKDLTDKDKAYIKVIHKTTEWSWDERISTLTNKFGVNERNIRRWIKKLGFSENKEIQNEELRASKLRKYKSKYLIITWAQNATPVHANFWNNILAYADFLGAEIGVIPGRYQNPTSLWSENMEGDEWWDEVFTKKDENGVIASTYLDSSHQNVSTYLDIIGDIKIVPTASNPLTGLEGISGNKSCIVGHPSLHLKSLPVLNGHANKLMLTTGACTLKNYTDTRSGKKAEFHHCMGFAIAELVDDNVFIRQVTAENSGNFIDLIYEVKDKKVSAINKCAAYIFGDIHVSQVYKPVVEETKRLFEHLSPRRIVLHDLFNGESVNHHEAKDPFASFKKLQEGKNLVGKEIEGVYGFIDNNDLIKYNPIVVRSNHDMWLERWLKEADWKKDLANAAHYLEYTSMLLSGKAEKGLLAYLLEKRYADKITCLGISDSFKMLGWELGQHGHLGAHGSKGNLEQYRKLNTKIIVGDYHTPGRTQGAASVGTYSERRMGYNEGASAWMHAGIILHTNGKIQHVIFSEDKFTTLF
jgi:hypothetical protein